MVWENLLANRINQLDGVPVPQQFVRASLSIRHL